MKIELSIIVPIYNVEKYIVECLESLLIQKPDNSEIILVNDGSQDNSINLLRDRFNGELLSGKLILIEQENQGVSVARNTGIAQSSGRYIGFVDADDMVLPHYFKIVLNAIHDISPDIIEIGWKTFVGANDIPTASSNYVHNNFGLYSTKDVVNEIFSASIWYPVIRFFKRELFDGHIFPVGVRFCEDMMVLHALYNQAETIYHIEHALYAYRMNPMGATRNVTAKYVEDIVAFYGTIIKLNQFHYRLLKINLFYLLFRCSTEAEIALNLPSDVQLDLKRIKCAPWLYRQVGIRKLTILLIPRLFSKWLSYKKIRSVKR